MTLKIVDIDIDDVVFAEYNPRQLSKDQYKQLKDSLKRFGIVDPIIVNNNPERHNILIGGHQRCKVWKDIGNKTIPAVYVNLPYDQERELNVRLNKNTGEFDFDILANNFDNTELISWGFTEEELFVDFYCDSEVKAEEISVKKETLCQCPECMSIFNYSKHKYNENA